MERLSTEDALLEQHQQLTRLLLALETLSARQQHLTSAASWEAVLEQKQIILDALMACAFGELCARTQVVVARLRREGKPIAADRLSTVLVTHGERLLRIAANERAAHKAAESYTTELRQALTARESRLTACKGYRSTNRRNARPRFYSGLR